MGTPSIHVIRKIEEISSPGACRWDHRRASWGEGSIAADGAGYARVRREKGEARGGRKMAKFERVIWIVLDSVGIGELPDAAEYGDTGRNTLGRIAHFADTNACGTWDWEHRAPAACAAGRNATRVLWKRRDSFTGKRYDHGTLGDGRSVAGPGVSRLQAGISAGSDGAV